MIEGAAPSVGTSQTMISQESHESQWITTPTLDIPPPPLTSKAVYYSNRSPILRRVEKLAKSKHINWPAASAWITGEIATTLQASTEFIGAETLYE
jgi:hypothetical protein